MPTPTRNDLQIGSADQAAREGMKGAAVGAVKWGIASVLGSFAAFYMSPIYRNLTIQFRVYLWMCPTTLGSMLEAESRMRAYEKMIRLQKRTQLDSAREAAMVEELVALQRFEEKFKEEQEAAAGKQ